MMDRNWPASRVVASDADMSRSSSVYSKDSEMEKTPLSSFVDSRNGSRAGNRAPSASYTPSFMSHHATKSTERLSTPTSPSQPNGHRLNRKPVNTTPVRPPPPDTPAQTAEPLPPPGVLLVLIAGTIPPPTISYLEMLLDRQIFSTIAITASTPQETTAKQLKMDTYALLGRVGKELAVLVYIRDEWDQLEMASTAQDVTKNGDTIQGVLCCPDFEDSTQQDVSILDLSDAQLQQSWKQSTSYMHTAIRTFTPSLLSRCTLSARISSGKALWNSFFLVAAPAASSAAAHISKAAIDQLLYQFEIATKARGLTTGHAASMLIPKPKVEIPGTEDMLLQPDVHVAHQQDQGFTPSESPTKLWNMWALRDEVGYAD